MRAKYREKVKVFSFFFFGRLFLLYSPHVSMTASNTTQPFQYKIAESPIPSAEEESSSEDEEDGPRKPKVDPDDPVARKSSSLLSKYSFKLLFCC